MTLFIFFQFAGDGLTSFLPYLAKLALSLKLSSRMLLSSSSIFVLSETFKNLTKPNFLPALFLLRATKTSTTVPILRNSCHSLASVHISGKLVKKKVDAFPPRLSLFKGDGTLFSTVAAASFILAGHNGGTNLGHLFHSAAD
ncbi:hypothetical protein LXL04_005979 [Taraxacum kok-saghyz]